VIWGLAVPSTPPPTRSTYCERVRHRSAAGLLTSSAPIRYLWIVADDSDPPGSQGR
jgi:hypothetical protein